MDEISGGQVLTLADGREVVVTSNYYCLFKLRQLNKAAYQHYNEAYLTMKTEPDYSAAMILYAAYLMGMIQETGGIKEAMSEEDFLRLLPVDRERNVNLMKELIAPNAKTASEKRS